MRNRFLAIDKGYFGIGLKSLDILILAQIEEFQRNGCQCYVTNLQFSDMFGESESSVKRSISKLESAGLILRNKIFISGNGKANNQRVLSIVNNKPEHNENMHGSERIMEGSNSINGRVNIINCEDHNEPIKDNIKHKIKDNKKNNENNNPNKNQDNKGMDEMYFEELSEIDNQRLIIDELTMNIEEQIRSNHEAYPDLEEYYYKKECEFAEKEFQEKLEERAMKNNNLIDERCRQNNICETLNEKTNRQRVPRRGLDEIEEEVMMSGFVEELIKEFDDMDDDL